jgi:chemotaxis protein MotB
MALFLVLWLMATREQQALQAQLKTKNSFTDGQGSKPEIEGGPRGSLIERFALPHNGSSADPGEGRPRQRVSYETPADLATLSRALATMTASAGLSSNLEAVVTPYGLRVMLHDTDRQGMFLVGSSQPNLRFQRLLRKMGTLFAEMENQMLIVGHTDSLQYAADTGMSNWTLSTNRAMAARAELLAGSMNPNSVLQVVGMADRAPFDTANAAAAVNRRIEMLVLTRGQAGSVAAMFGAAGKTEPLVPGADIGMPEAPGHKQVPDARGLRQLRDQLTSRAHAQDAPAPQP